jgi:hypothetical protein
MSAQARTNGGKWALHSLSKTPKNVDWPLQEFGRSELANPEVEMCDKHFYSQCRYRPGQRASMEMARAT